ncbi:MAG: hypothetical protein QM642_02250 [Edaphocola sp.]
MKLLFRVFFLLSAVVLGNNHAHAAVLGDGGKLVTIGQHASPACRPSIDRENTDPSVFFSNAGTHGNEYAETTEQYSDDDDERSDSGLSPVRKMQGGVSSLHNFSLFLQVLLGFVFSDEPTGAYVVGNHPLKPVDHLTFFQVFRI